MTLIEFAKWCVSEKFDSRELDARAREALSAPAPTPTDIERNGATEALNSCTEKLGDMIVRTERGVIHAVEAPGFMTLQIGRDSATHIGLMLYNPKVPAYDEGDTGLGMYTQLEPDNARHIASSLFKLAEGIAPMVRQ